jgi:hypothetical protein
MARSREIPMRTRRFRSINAIWILLLGVCQERAAAQCSGIVTSPAQAAACTDNSIPDSNVAIVDKHRPYSLAELIDIGERNHPTT